MTELRDLQWIEDAVATVREALEVDGHELRVELHEGVVTMAIRSGADACVDCLLPDDVLGGIAHEALVRCGLDHPVRVAHRPTGG